MSLLNQLWDDTLAGPMPESGLGKLRKCQTLSLPTAKESDVVRANETVKVTRSIMIMKSPRTNNNNQDGFESVSPAASPSGSTPPVSPFAGGAREEYRFRRKSLSDIANEKNRIRLGSPRPPHDV